MNDLNARIEAVFSDECHWHWWSARTPDYLLLEFVGVALYLPPPAPTQPPGNHFGLYFERPRTIQFLEFGEDIESGWPERLHGDQIRGGRVNPGHCVFGDVNHAADLLSRAGRSHEFFHADGSASEGSPAFAFQTDQGIGLFVAADQVVLMTSQGKFPLERIPQMREDWWSYWKRWWKQYRSPQPLPYDALCAGRFPAGPIEGD